MPKDLSVATDRDIQYTELESIEQQEDLVDTDGDNEDVD